MPAAIPYSTHMPARAVKRYFSQSPRVLREANLNTRSLVSSRSWLGQVFFGATGDLSRSTQLGSPGRFSRREIDCGEANQSPVLSENLAESGGEELLQPRRKPAPTTIDWTPG
ncbi:hypothetical protein Bbelb_268970 [Branchiostoma belcheri]|nr:hypothetical protein Bbelb_268970 [Branchiostoma belcheri]